MSPPMSRRIAPLQQVAKGREDQAAARLGQAQRRLAEREARLRELSEFCREYEPQISGSSMPLLMNARLFAMRLREAEAFQGQLTAQARAEVDVERKRWLVRHGETGTLDMLAEIYRDREAQVERRRADRTLDEHALRRHVARNDQDAA